MIALNKENFEEEVLKAEGKVLVDYYSEACAPCAALTPFVEGLAKEYGDKLKFASLDIAKARRLAISQRVLGLPVVAIYQNGEKIEELVKDDATPENVEAMVKRHI